MRERLLQWSVCLACGGDLTLEAADSRGDEVIEGKLYCQCGEVFPIIGGVPRLLCRESRLDLLQQYPDFFRRHPELFINEGVPTPFRSKEMTKPTMDRFGYEWLEFSDYDCNNFERFIAPLPSSFLQEKIGLDVGCGAGRHAKEVTALGAEVVCIDLSRAVDAAHVNNSENNFVHIVQADIYRLPFRPRTFDFIFSIGVLHHLPNPEQGYQALLPFLKDGASIFVWLYAHAARKVALEILRHLARPLSNENIRRLAYLCNLVDYGICINFYRFAERLPLLGRLVKRWSPLRVKEYAAHGFRVGYTDWFDRLSAPISNYYKEHEMHNWLKRSGLVNTRLLLEGDSWWWLYGERKGPM